MSIDFTGLPDFLTSARADLRVYMKRPQNLLFSNKDLWHLIWPLITERFLSITLGVADIVMVASLGESAVSGVSLVDTIFILIQTIFGALATGGAVVCSQFIGQKRADKASRTAVQLLYVMIIGAVIIMIFGLFLNKALLSILFGNVETSVMDNARTYFTFMLIGLPSIAIYNGCSAIFRAQGNSKVSMFTSILVNIINISGNAIMLFGLKSGVEGVAIPTFIARTIAAAILFSLLYKSKPGFKINAPVQEEVNKLDQISIREIGKVRFEGYLIKKILHIGIPTGLESSVFHIGKILVITLVASFGTGALAANAAANTISAFEVLPASSIGLALLTVVGQCMGAGRTDQAVYYTKKLMILAYISMAALNIPLLICAKQLIGLYGMSPETTYLGWKMLMCHGLMGILFWPAAFTLPNALRAANDVKFTMTVSFVSMWTVRIGMSYLLANTFGLGAFGPWVAMSMDWISRSVAFILRFLRGKWKTKRLI